jgi:hypothetical protein
VIDLPVIITTLSLGVEIGIGTDVIDLPIIITNVIVPCVGKAMVCCGGSWI